jgi:hypothetical protein
MSKGFVILAQNTDKINYVKCAEVLAYSIKNCMPKAKVALITNNEFTGDVFDYVIPLPYGDLAPNSDWKLINDWQIYEATPFKETIKLEADMYIPSNIDYWWNVLKNQNVVVCTNIRNFKGEISDIKFYRKFITDNKLPDTYNAITYFKKNKFSEKFFKTVRNIFENWEEFTKILKCNQDELATTDWVYALACHIHGEEKTTMPFFNELCMVHMKQYINNLLSENWTLELVPEVSKEYFKINTFPQLYPFHYHVKDFSKPLGEIYGC